MNTVQLAISNFSVTYYLIQEEINIVKAIDGGVF
jgi:hypothetical protein